MTRVLVFATTLAGLADTDQAALLAGKVLTLQQISTKQCGLSELLRGALRAETNAHSLWQARAQEVTGLSSNSEDLLNDTMAAVTDLGARMDATARQI